MATTKKAQYRFVIKESPERTHEPREGVLEMVYPPFIIAEPCGTEPAGERPLKDPDFLSLDLAPGLSLDEAQRVADFLNDHLLSVAITRFGDAEDVAREVRQDTRKQRLTAESFEVALEVVRGQLSASDVTGAIESLRAIEAWGKSLLNDWSRALQKFHTEGTDEDSHA